MRGKVIRAAAGAAVLLVGGAFLAPIIQEVREEERRAPCKSNLRILGIALRQYDSLFGSFPGGTLPNGALPPEKRFSWIMACLPYMICGAMPDHERDQPWDAEPNRFLAVTPVHELSCPDPPLQSSPGDQSAVHDLGPSSDPALYPSPFIGIAGVGRDAALLPKGDPKAGVFGYERTTTLGDITDGAGSTMMVVETSDLRGAWTAGGPATVRGLDPSRAPYIGRGNQFGGNHRGGTLVLLADGSVRFVRETVHPRVFEGLATIAGGEKVGQGWGE